MLIKKIKYLICIIVYLLILSGILKAEEKFEIRNTYSLGTYSFTDDNAKATSLSLIYNDLKKIVLFAGITIQNKFKMDDSLEEVGCAYKLNEKIVVQETAGVSSNKKIYPKLFSDTVLMYRLIDKISLNIGGQINYFNNADVRIASLGAAYYPSIKINFNVKLLHAITDFKNITSRDANNSYIISIGYIPNSIHDFSFSYINNTESYLIVDQIGKFKADTYMVNWNKYLQKNLWLIAGIGYQKRIKPISAYQRNIEIGLKYKW